MRFVRLGILVIAWLVTPVAVVGQLAPRTAGAPRLTLNAAVAEALEKNLDLIAARAGVATAGANLITARTSLASKPYAVQASASHRSAGEAPPCHLRRAG